MGCTEFSNDRSHIRVEKRFIMISTVSSKVLALCVYLALSFTPLSSSADFFANYTYTVFNGKATITDCRSGYGALTIPSTLGGCPVTSIGDAAFAERDYLTSITIPDCVTSIGPSAFAACYRLTGITIPDGITSIENRVFENCRSLTGIAIPSSVTNIGNWAFYGCYSLPGIEIPSGVASIGDWAFSGCYGLAGITIPSGVATIGSRAFSGCKGLPSVSIPSGVTNIGKLAFSECSGLSAITVEALNPKYSSVAGVLFNKKRTELIKCPDRMTGNYSIPGSVTNIAESAFSGCNGLTGITIPASVTSIGDAAFSGCRGLTGITIPASVTSIGNMAFDGCPSLSNVYFRGNAPVDNNTVFMNDDTVTVYYFSRTTGWGPTFGGRPTIPWPNRMPLMTVRSPSVGQATVNEGASIVFSVTANDSTDDDTIMRGMSNVVWYVDDVRMLETRAGAPNAITSVFTFRPGWSTVQGVTFRDLEVRTVASDRQGGSTGTVWTVRVNNLPASQTITFAALPIMEIGVDVVVAPGATASSGLPVTYASSAPAVAEIKDGLIHIVGTGTAVITARQQSGGIDFKDAVPVTQTLTVKARLAAEFPDGGGTVTGVGLYMPGTQVALTAKPTTGHTFLRWEDGSQTTSRCLVMLNTSTVVSAFFGITTNVAPPVVGDPGPQRAMVGVPFTLPLDIQSDSLPAVAVAGLPAGLKYSATAKSITGVPTASVTNRTVTVTAKNVNKTQTERVFSVTVDPLPQWAWGSFNGTAEMETLGSGNATMSITPAGRTTGKLTLRGTNYSFSAWSYAFRDEEGSFWLTTTAKVGVVAFPLTLTVGVPEISALQDIVPGTLGKAVGVFGTDGQTTLYRNVWKDSGMAAGAALYTGYYTATMPGWVEYGSGYLTLTVDKVGGVKTAGKLADGTAVTLSGTLILDEAGRIWTVLYTSPAAYKGGGLFGLVEFIEEGMGTHVVLGPLDGVPLLWQSLNPQATQLYGLGFSRDLDLSGGWYDKLINLRTYYEKGLTVGAVALPEMTTLVKITDWDETGTRKITRTEPMNCGAADASPNGVVLSVTPATGIGAGFAVPRADTPIRNIETGEYDYTADSTGDGVSNTGALTVNFTRATGLFKGSFKAWYDYVSAEDRTTGGVTLTHTSKSVAFEGVLTPERANRSDGVGGRGFFLWANKGEYLTPQGKPVPYSFSWSYDLSLLLSE